MMRKSSWIDEALATANRALSTMSANKLSASVPVPPVSQTQAPLSDRERRLSQALMRVNHVGEVCAQALYEAHALGTQDQDLKRLFLQSAREEADHLAWTRRRIEELEGRVSALNPLWYLGAFAIGLASTLR